MYIDDEVQEGKEREEEEKEEEETTEGGGRRRERAPSVVVRRRPPPPPPQQQQHYGTLEYPMYHTICTILRKRTHTKFWGCLLIACLLTTSHTYIHTYVRLTISRESLANH